MAREKGRRKMGRIVMRPTKFSGRATSRLDYLLPLSDVPGWGMELEPPVVPEVP